MRYAPDDSFCGRKRNPRQLLNSDDSTELFAFDLFFTRDSFARLVAYRTARFASGLTGTSAFATTGYFLVSGFCNRFNHNVPPNFLFFAYKVYAMYLSIIV